MLIQDAKFPDEEKQDDFMNPPVIEEDTEETEKVEEKPKNKGGRPKKS